MRGMPHSPQRYLEGHLKTLGGGGRNSVRSGGREHIANELDGFTHHIGETRSKTRSPDLQAQYGTPAALRDDVTDCHQSGRDFFSALIGAYLMWWRAADCPSPRRAARIVSTAKREELA